MRFSGCQDPGSAMMCEGFARQIHGNLLSQFGLTATQLPILELDTLNWENPFSSASSEARR